MVRAYDDYGNVVDLVEWEKEIRANEQEKTIDEFVTAIRESNKGHWRTTRYEHGESVCETMSYDIGVIKNIAEQLKEQRCRMKTDNEIIAEYEEKFCNKCGHKDHCHTPCVTITRYIFELESEE